MTVQSGKRSLVGLSQWDGKAKIQMTKRRPIIQWILCWAKVGKPLSAKQTPIDSKLQR
jgi:hypothetical protein